MFLKVPVECLESHDSHILVPYTDCHVHFVNEEKTMYAPACKFMLSYVGEYFKSTFDDCIGCNYVVVQTPDHSCNSLFLQYFYGKKPVFKTIDEMIVFNMMLDYCLLDQYTDFCIEVDDQTKVNAVLKYLPSLPLVCKLLKDVEITRDLLNSYPELKPSEFHHHETKLFLKWPNNYISIISNVRVASHSCNYYSQGDVIYCNDNPEYVIPPNYTLVGLSDTGDAFVIESCKRNLLILKMKTVSAEPIVLCGELVMYYYKPVFSDGNIIYNGRYLYCPEFNGKYEL